MAKRSRILVAALGMAALAAGAVFLLRGSGVRYAVAPDAGGPIRAVACLIASGRRSTLRNDVLVNRIVNALPARTRVTILTNDRAAFTVARDPHPGRVTLLDLSPKANFTIWPQDPFLVLAGPEGKRLLLVSREFDRADDRLIAERLAGHFGWAQRTSTLRFEGGNIVVGPRHVFIGANTIRYNAVKQETSDVEVARQFQRELGRPVIVLGPVPQPVGHIDMAVTALDEARMAVADAGWGARLAQEQLRDDPEAVRAFEEACERNYFGDPRIRELVDAEGKAIRPPEVIGQTAVAADETGEIAVHLDRLAEELGRRGYHVFRMPFLFRRSRAAVVSEEPCDSPPPPSDRPSPSALADGDAAADVPEAKPDYPCLTYNNVLLESHGGSRTVYLPQYGWRAMDDAARRAWEESGFTVVAVEGFAVSAMHGGSLRCCVKVLERDEAAAHP